MAANEQVLLQVWNSMFVLPKQLPNKELKVQDKNGKLNRISSAETAADREQQPMIPTSSHT
ncbi:MAG: hypothetical protein A2546_00820 [Sphingobacteriia bacterium RIFOXYD2_FULL_35_12]|nr:MAG: hypothetical protein A2472_14050 [Sphingobacteriia bacterium RIFOXYC2_FULL_35_18]OHC88171.1 MAG: hypothetical protein A2546_00820 [Sphingobacteriia bacterium RIFOXYD2_FULL_35_12]